MAKVEFSVPPDRQEIRISALLDAPLKSVYRAFTDPRSIPSWWGPAGLDTEVQLLELRAGGRWRFVQRDPDGNSYAFHGVYHEIVPEKRLVDTFEYEGMPGHVLLEIITFAEEGSQTRLSEHIIYQSMEDRDGMLQTGMESGHSEGLQRLESLARGKAYA